MPTSATAARVSLSVALTGVGAEGSLAVTVLTRGSVVRPDENVTGTVNVSRLPEPAARVAPVVPKLVAPVVPVTTPHVAVPVATQVAFEDSATPAARLSVTVRLAALLGPPLLTTTV